MGRILSFALALLSAAAVASAGPEPGRVGIEERLGQVLPLEGLVFRDEEGKPVRLAALFDRPVAMTLVYYRCPSICTPLLQGLADAAGKTGLDPGRDYRLVTISFDPADSPEIATVRRKNMLAFLKRPAPPEAWRFLTGDADSIRRVTEAVGFRYIRDPNRVDFVHAATVIFLARDGKIVRYLNGTAFSPADIKMALLDATEGRARSFMQRIQQICYSYDPEGRSYALKLNRIILAVTLAFAAGFALYLTARKGRRSPGKG